jgi:GDP-mannose pyrophosphatase NudK
MSAAGTGGPRVVAEEELYRGFVRLSRVTVEIRWQGDMRQLAREIHDHGHVAAILPVDPGRGTGILIRQFRVTPFLDGEDGWMWEIPAGLLDGETPERCAGREAQEETGVTVSGIASLGTVWTSPGIVKERVHLFWGRYSGPPPAATAGLDHENEMIEVHELPMSEIAGRLDAGQISDAKSALTLHRLRRLRPDLFDRQ